MRTIATWNVNSLRVRLPQLTDWLAGQPVHTLALQETKLEDSAFPRAELEALGFEVACSGQRTYNGVAILARAPITDIVTDMPGFEDPQRRVLAATIDGIRIVNLYVPNGQSVGSEKYEYKLRWLESLCAWLAGEVARHPQIIVLGDFNVAPDDRDVHDPAIWNDDSILTSTAERAALRRLMDLGLRDSFRLHHEEGGLFSWWDYRAAGFRRNLGLRIDLALVSDALAPHAKAAGIDREPRTWDRPSDHAPVWVELG